MSILKALRSLRRATGQGDRTGKSPPQGDRGQGRQDRETGGQGDKETRARETRRQDRETGRQDRETSKKHRGLNIGGGGTFATGYGSQTGP